MFTVAFIPNNMGFNHGQILIEIETISLYVLQHIIIVCYLACPYFTGYSNYFIQLKDVVLDKDYCSIEVVGGGNQKDAGRQMENDEVN